MSDFWKAIREYRPRKKKKGEAIKKEAWEGHFKKLLGGEVEEEKGEGQAGEEEEGVRGGEGRITKGGMK